MIPTSEFDDRLGSVDVDNVSRLSVNPGIDVEVPVNHVWSLRPCASIGFVGYTPNTGPSDSFSPLMIGYRTSSDRDLRGIPFVFRSKFDE